MGSEMCIRDRVNFTIKGDVADFIYTVSKLVIKGAKDRLLLLLTEAAPWGLGVTWQSLLRV